MNVREYFNDSADGGKDARHRAVKVNDNVLFTEFRTADFYQRAYFDFLSRTVAVLVYGSNHDRTLTFDEMDPEVLEIHHAMLKELGGRPRPLPARHEKPSFRPPLGGLNP